MPFTFSESAADCVICLEPWTDPVELLPCGDLFCRTCASALAVCLICDADVTGTAAPHRVVANLADGVPAVCDDCGWEGTRETSRRHTCPPGPRPPACAPVVERAQNVNVSRPCREHPAGTCRHGDNCRFANAPSTTAPAATEPAAAPLPQPSALWTGACGDALAGRECGVPGCTRSHDAHVVRIVRASLRRKPCANMQRAGNCTQGDRCFYSHDPEVLRAAASPHQPTGAIRNAMCRDALAGRTCAEPGCTRSHDANDVRVARASMRRKPCAFMQHAGNCNQGDRCFYSHDPEVLRAAAQPAAAQPAAARPAAANFVIDESKEPVDAATMDNIDAARQRGDPSCVVFAPVRGKKTALAFNLSEETLCNLDTGAIVGSLEFVALRPAGG